MNQPVIKARGLRKTYGKGVVALDGVDFTVGAGRIVGLMGPNGAGKTTALKAILGLTQFEGELSVLGRDPRISRDQLMNDVCFIADVAVLPKWLRVRNAIDYVAGVHPRFDRAKAQDVLARTEVRRDSRIGELSKGMITQLHLALIMAIDARLLVLDEPTLGLDLLYRRTFYEALLNDYFDHETTILVTTHQVEEVEHLLTDVLLINHGRIVLDSAVDQLPNRFVQLVTTAEHLPAALKLQPIHEREVFGRHVLVYDGCDRAELEGLGELRTPSIADLFVASMQGVRQ
ncbi:MAG: ABC transporter ATP-binding protein [Gammaproteobacteria bacterium]|nr:ABC transporter ATP-binding protein [Gammaproteobacteria bacterium]